MIERLALLLGPRRADLLEQRTAPQGERPPERAWVALREQRVDLLEIAGQWHIAFQRVGFQAPSPCNFTRPDITRR